MILPDGYVLTATDQGKINILDQLSERAQTATVLKNLKSSSLISLGQVCDDNCTIVMDADKLYATKSKNICIDVRDSNKLMRGLRNPLDGLYDIPIQPTTIQHNYALPPVKNAVQNINLITSSKSIPNKNKKVLFQTKKIKKTVSNMPINKFNNIILPIIAENNKTLCPVSINPSSKLNVILQKNETKKDLVTFLHGAMWSPVPSTWIKAVKNTHFRIWPGLTAALITKHLQPSIPTAEGHMQQERQGLQSTKTKQQKQTKLLSSKNITTTDDFEEKPQNQEKGILNHSNEQTTVKCTDLSRSGLLNPTSCKLRMDDNIFADQATLPSLTSQDVVTVDATLNDDLFPPSPVPNIKSNETLYYLSDADDLRLAYSDLTGKFPLQSSRGNNY